MVKGQPNHVLISGVSRVMLQLQFGIGMRDANVTLLRDQQKLTSVKKTLNLVSKARRDFYEP